MYQSLDIQDQSPASRGTSLALPLRLFPWRGTLLLGGASLLVSFAAASGQEGRLADPAKAPMASGDEASDDALAGVLLAMDGKPAAPGRLPEGTPEDAAALWQKLVAGIGTGAALETPRSFEISFEGRIRAETGASDLFARFAYLDAGPGLVRGIVTDKNGEPKSIQMRGIGAGDRPEYWYRKTGGSAVTDWNRLTRRENRDSLEETDGWAAISYDIARLTDPKSFRILKLRRRSSEDPTTLAAGVLSLQGDPGIRLPDTNLEGVVGGRGMGLRELAAPLEWLELTTPDFKEFGGGAKTAADRRREREAKKAPTRRLIFGLDPKTGRPQLVIVAPAGGEIPLVVPGSLLLQCTDWFPAGPEGKPKSTIPGRFLAYEAVQNPNQEEVQAGLPYRFSDTTNADMFIRTGDMNAGLRMSDFLPPK